MLETALKYYSYGLSIVPVGTEKIPKIHGDEHNYKWDKHKKVLIKPNGIFKDAYGVGIVAGKVSGNLEVIDIDQKYCLTKTLCEDYKALVHRANPNILKKLVVEKTVSGGYHFIYRCEKIEGNLKLASRYSTEEELALKPKERQKVLIETRGEAGFIVCAPTKGYEIIYGSFDKINTLTIEERETLLECAKQINEVPIVVVEKKEYIKPDIDDGYELSPFDDWNDRGDVQSFLETEGWKTVITRGYKNLMLRPGGTGKCSADWDSNKRLFYVFTSSTEFDINKAYNPVQVILILKFNNSLSDCAKWLRSSGYGSQSNRRVKEQPIVQTKITDLSFLAKKEEVDMYIRQVIDGTFQMGLPTGIKKLDEYYLFKKSTLVLVNGHDNVGKSSVNWYLAVLSAMYHGWKWGILSAENKTGGVTRKLMEFYLCKGLEYMTPDEVIKARTFVDEHFYIVDNDEIYSPMDVLAMIKLLIEHKAINFFMIDPFNALDREATNYHEYDYKALSEMKLLIRKTGCGIFVNCHAVTESLRKTYKIGHEHEGYPMPPQKADTEGGGKFANKADDFITIHRMVQHPSDWKITEIHIRKIKEVETGGRPTAMHEPVKLIMMAGGIGFTEITTGQNAVKDYWASRLTPLSHLTPNYNFTEKQKQSHTEPSQDCPF